MRAILLILAAALAAGCGPEVRRTWYGDGTTWSEVRYKDGVPHGAWRTWWPNGRLKSEGAYEDGDLHGPWRTWFEDGSPQTEQLYARGRPEGRWLHYYANGNLVTEGRYRRGRKDGTWREYFGDGTLKAEGAFEDGVPTGKASVYLPDGRLETRTTYDDEGRSVYMELWNPTNQTWSRAEGPLANDRRHGLWKVYRPDGTLLEEHSGTYVDGELVPEAPAEDAESTADADPVEEG